MKISLIHPSERKRMNEEEMEDVLRLFKFPYNELDIYIRYLPNHLDCILISLHAKRTDIFEYLNLKLKFRTQNDHYHLLIFDKFYGIVEKHAMAIFNETYESMTAQKKIRTLVKFKKIDHARRLAEVYNINRYLKDFINEEQNKKIDTFNQNDAENYISQEITRQLSISKEKVYFSYTFMYILIFRFPDIYEKYAPIVDFIDEIEYDFHLFIKHYEYKYQLSFLRTLKFKRETLAKIGIVYEDIKD